MSIDKYENPLQDPMGLAVLLGLVIWAIAILMAISIPIILIVCALVIIF